MRPLSVVLSATGLVFIVVGTFLPWVVSGGVSRNSYAIVGIVRRLGFVGHGFSSIALSLWPLIGPIVMVAWIAGILRWWRSAAIVTVVIGLLTGIIGAGVLAVAGGDDVAGIGLASAGPVVTLLGAIAAITGAIVVLLVVRRGRGTAHPADDLSPTNVRISGPGNRSFPSGYQQ